MKHSVITQARRWFPQYVKHAAFRRIGADQDPLFSDVVTADPEGNVEISAPRLRTEIDYRLDWHHDWKALFPPVHDRPPAVLIIDWRVPSPDLDSGSYRMTRLIESLLRTNPALHFIGAGLATAVSPDIGAKDGVRYRVELQSKGITVIEGMDPAIEHLCTHGGQYHTIMLSRPNVAADFLPLVRAFCPQARVIFDTVDLHWVRFARGAAVTSSQFERDDLLARSEWFKRMELATVRSADLTIAITQEEREILSIEAPNIALEVLPNIHEVTERVPSFDARSGLLFIGGFNHYPNVEAVKFFVTEIFPIIRTQIRDIEFVILGSAMPPEIERLNSSSIRAVGYVDDVTPYFESARVFVAPLLHGAGMKGKVGQSLSFGLPLVTTSIGAEGMGLIDNESAMVSDDPKGFAERVVRLYNDVTLWNQLSANGRAIIEENFSSKALDDKIRELFAAHD